MTRYLTEDFSEVGARVIADVFGDWRRAWELAAEQQAALPESVREAVLANTAPDPETASAMMRAAWTLIHPEIQQLHIDRMGALERVALDVLASLSSGLGRVEGMEDRVAELERENERLRRFVDLARDLLGEALVHADEDALRLVVEPAVAGDRRED